jgi:branched-chain amino acid transport system permease protein
VVGALIFQFLYFTIDAVMASAQADIAWVGELLTPAEAGQIKLIFVGVGLMLLMIYRPQGLLGNRNEVLIDG